MALTRKDKPDWFALTDRVRAIFELEIATQAELARFLKVPDQRVREWIQHVREPKAQIVLSILTWANVTESRMTPQEAHQRKQNA
jgi:DNA-binding transcriptional regulator YiaG